MMAQRRVINQPSDGPGKFRRIEGFGDESVLAVVDEIPWPADVRDDGGNP